MQRLYKQFVELVTRWRINDRIDEFFAARLGLTLYYLITAVVILGGSSIILYDAILTNFTNSILESGLDSDISQVIIAEAKGILLDRFLTIDSIIIIFTVMIGFFLTYKTLKPIKANMQKQKRFIADASHELRTPVAVIISGLEVALNNKKLDLNLAKKILENTLDEMREFSKLNNNLLDISKYDMPIHLKCEAIDIRELIKSIINKIGNLASSKEVIFEAKIIEMPVMIDGNKMELERVFYNILDNAIKYTPKEGRVYISDEIIFNEYVVTVNDSGVGIPKNIINRIFDPFFRGDVSRNSNGAGLGLTLSKKIIENHKGTISIKSDINKGTKVTISLPISSQ